ncbi:MAG: hypothetical protein Q9161_006136 [Pseudevernia consocians]
MLGINKLPQELRDKIYEAALVRDVIIVVPTELQNGENVSRSTWQHNTSPTITGPGGVSARICGKPVTYSYHLQANNEDTPNLNLFHTSCQVYAECWPIFYKQNMFDFSNAETSIIATSMCLAFLNDRSQQALQHIRRLHLIFGEPLYRHGWSNPTSFSPQWGQLCIRISTVLSLHQLVLTVNERFPKRLVPWPALESDRARLPPWMQGVCRITNLRKLELDVASDRQDGLELINHLRVRMLAHGSDLLKMGEKELLYTIKVVEGRSLAVVSNYIIPKKYSANGVLVPYPTWMIGFSFGRLAEVFVARQWRSD